MDIIRQMLKSTTPEFIILGYRLFEIANATTKDLMRIKDKKNYGGDELLPNMMTLMAKGLLTFTQKDINRFKAELEKNSNDLHGEFAYAIATLNVAILKIDQLINLLIEWCEKHHPRLARPFINQQITLGQWLEYLDKKLSSEQKKLLYVFIEVEEKKRVSSCSSELEKTIEVEDERVNNRKVSDIFGDQTIFNDTNIANFITKPCSIEDFRKKEYLYSVLIEQLSAYPELKYLRSLLMTYFTQLENEIFNRLNPFDLADLIPNYNAIHANAAPWIKSIFELVEKHPGKIPQITVLLAQSNQRVQQVNHYREDDETTNEFLFKQLNIKFEAINRNSDNMLAAVSDAKVIIPISKGDFRKKEYLYSVLIEQLSAYSELKYLRSLLMTYFTQLENEIFNRLNPFDLADLIPNYNAIHANAPPWIKSIFELVEKHPGKISQIAILLVQLNEKIRQAKQCHLNDETKNDLVFHHLNIELASIAKHSSDILSSITHGRRLRTELELASITQICHEYIRELKRVVSNRELAKEKIVIVTSALEKLNGDGDIETRLKSFKTYLLMNQAKLAQERPTLWDNFWQKLKPYLGMRSKPKVTTGSKLHLLANQGCFPKSLDKLKDLKAIEKPDEELELTEIKSPKKTS